MTVPCRRTYQVRVVKYYSFLLILTHSCQHVHLNCDVEAEEYEYDEYDSEEGDNGSVAMDEVEAVQESSDDEDADGDDEQQDEHQEQKEKQQSISGAHQETGENFDDTSQSSDLGMAVLTAAAESVGEISDASQTSGKGMGVGMGVGTFQTTSNTHSGSDGGSGGSARLRYKQEGKRGNNPPRGTCPDSPERVSPGTGAGDKTKRDDKNSKKKGSKDRGTRAALELSVSSDEDNPGTSTKVRLAFPLLPVSLFF
jgi:hypothetical protein